MEGRILARLYGNLRPHKPSSYSRANLVWRAVGVDISLRSPPFGTTLSFLDMHIPVLWFISMIFPLLKQCGATEIMDSSWSVKDKTGRKTNDGSFSCKELVLALSIASAQRPSKKKDSRKILSFTHMFCEPRNWDLIFFITKCFPYLWILFQCGNGANTRACW